MVQKCGYVNITNDNLVTGHGIVIRVFINNRLQGWEAKGLPKMLMPCTISAWGPDASDPGSTVYLVSDIKKHSGSHYLYRCPFTFDGFLALSIRTSFLYFSPVFAAYWSVLTTTDGCQLQEELEGNSPPFSACISLGSLVSSHPILHLWRGVPTIIRPSLSFLPHCWTPHVHGHLKGHATA